MKYVVLFFALLLAFVLGYLLEPSLRDSLTGERKKNTPAPPEEEVVTVPVVDPEPVPEPVPEPAPEPDPAPEPVDDDEPAPPPPASDNELREIMYQSIQQAEIERFTIGQVTEWKSFGEEVIDGQTYRVGIIDYKEDTIFGERTFEAKALIRDGKVEKWIWTSNGMRIE